MVWQAEEDLCTEAQIVTVWVSSTEGAILQCELLKASSNAAVSLWWHLNVQLPRFGIFVTWWVQYPSADKAGQIGVRKKERQSASEALPCVNWNGIEKISPPLVAGISPLSLSFPTFQEAETALSTCGVCLEDMSVVFSSDYRRRGRISNNAIPPPGCFVHTNSLSSPVMTLSGSLWILSRHLLRNLPHERGICKTFHLEESSKLCQNLIQMKLISSRAFRKDNSHSGCDSHSTFHNTAGVNVRRRKMLSIISTHPTGGTSQHAPWLSTSLPPVAEPEEKESIFLTPLIIYRQYLHKPMTRATVEKTFSVDFREWLSGFVLVQSWWKYKLFSFSEESRAI